MSQDTFYIWTIYDHPSDYPDCYVTRAWDGITGKATNHVLTANTPGELIEKIGEIDPNACQFIPRADQDDPVILGCYF